MDKQPIPGIIQASVIVVTRGRGLGLLLGARFRWGHQVGGRHKFKVTSEQSLGRVRCAKKYNDDHVLRSFLSGDWSTALGSVKKCHSRISRVCSRGWFVGGQWGGGRAGKAPPFLESAALWATNGGGQTRATLKAQKRPSSQTSPSTTSTSWTTSWTQLGGARIASTKAFLLKKENEDCEK